MTLYSWVWGVTDHYLGVYDHQDEQGISIYVTGIAFLILWVRAPAVPAKSRFKERAGVRIAIAVCFSQVIVSDCSSILITRGNGELQ